jgi:hypothetical protein
LRAAAGSESRRQTSAVVGRMFGYADSISRDLEGKNADVYIKCRIKVERSNSLLFFIPSMYVIAKGSHDYVEEYYSTIPLGKSGFDGEVPHVYTGTILSDRDVKSVPAVARYLTSDIYSPTLFRSSILSPFNRKNRKYYLYKVANIKDGLSRVVFKPRIDNTRLVQGSVIVDRNTGRIFSSMINGEFDMLAFGINLVMGDSDSVLPRSCDINVTFRFAGNQVRSVIRCVFMPPSAFAGRFSDKESRTLMDKLRPLPLSVSETAIYNQYDSSMTATDSGPKDEKLYKVAWNAIDDNLLNNFSAKLGSNDQLSFRTSPVLNPFYLSYSQRKGITYRFDVKSQYDLTENSNLSMRVKAGYMFKQHKFYYNIPFIFDYDKKRHGAVMLTFGNGNRITNSSVLDQLKSEKSDSVDFSSLNLDYFNDMYLKLNNTYDISDRLNVDAGIIFHKRTPVNNTGFILTGRPTVYRTFAPMVKLTYRPFKSDGPVFRLDYEKGIKGILGSRIGYERWETDESYVVNLGPLSALSMRLGGGFYSNRSRNIYFLDYSNFRENNLPGGWNDNWSGDFQLLDPNWYNASRFYIRTNLTYEHPILLISRLPSVGRYIETERVYINTLWVDHIHPYVEYGYGFSNRFFSMGFFASTRNWHFQNAGCRFTLELFGRWR